VVDMAISVVVTLSPEFVVSSCFIII